MNRPDQLWCSDLTYIPIKQGGGSISLPSWTGTAVRSCHGDYQTRWIHNAASRHWKRLRQNMARLIYSIQIRAASLHPLILHASWKSIRAPSLWMVKGDGWIMFLLNASGAAWNMNASISMHWNTSSQVPPPKQPMIWSVFIATQLSAFIINCAAQLPLNSKNRPLNLLEWSKQMKAISAVFAKVNATTVQPENHRF